MNSKDASLQFIGGAGTVTGSKHLLRVWRPAPRAWGGHGFPERSVFRQDA